MAPPLALLRLSADPQGRIAAFDFGAPPPPRASDRTIPLEVRLDHLLASFAAHRDEVWELEQPLAAELLTQRLAATPPGAPELPAMLAAAGDMRLGKLGRAVAAHRDDPQRAARLAALIALGKIAADAEVPWIEAQLTHPDPEVRLEAVRALGRIPDAAILPVLDAAGAADPSIVAEVQWGKQKIVVPLAVDSLAEAARYVEMLLGSSDYEDLLGLMFFASIPLVELVESQAARPDLRARAAYLLSLGCVRTAAPAMSQVLARADAEPLDLRVYAALGLGRFHTRQATGVLLAQLSRPPAERWLKVEALRALARIAKASTLEPILAAWDVDGGALREPIRAAARSLATAAAAAVLASPVDPSTATGALAIIDGDRLTHGYDAAVIDAQLRSPSPAARRDAAVLLGWQGPPHEAPRLLAMASTDPDPDVRSAAAAAYARAHARAP